MQIALIHNHFDTDHLAQVKAEMALLGAPKIKAVYSDALDVWVALEGCHRIRAAKDLGLTPEIEEVEYSDTVTTNDLGLDFGGDVWLVSDIVDRAFRSAIIKF